MDTLVPPPTSIPTRRSATSPQSSPPVKKRAKPVLSPERSISGAAQNSTANTSTAPCATTELPKYWLIKRTEGGSFSKASPILINRYLLAHIGEVESVTKTGSGFLVVGISSQTQARKIKNLNTLGDIEVTTCEHTSLNCSRGVIHCRDLMYSSVEEIKEELSSQGVIDVQQVTRRVGEGKTEPTGTYFLTFRSVTLPERIKIAFYRGIRVRPYIPAPLRCFKCLKFGHVSGRCRQQNDTCICGRQVHTGTECTKPMICVNCRGDHSSRSTSCPEFVLEKEIQRVKVVNKLSYPEAKRLVKDSAYAMPAVSYAAKAAMPQPQVITSENSQDVIPIKRKNRKRSRKTTSAVGSISVPQPDGRSLAPATSGCPPTTPPLSVRERGCNTSPQARRQSKPRAPRYDPPSSNIIEVEGRLEEDEGDPEEFEVPVSHKARSRTKKGRPKGKPRT